MKLSTQGTRYHREHTLPVYYQQNEDFTGAINAADRYKIILIHSGSGIIRLNSASCPFLAPALCCFNETDRVDVERAVPLHAETLYFHPQYLNSTLSFTSINARTPEDTLAADRMDYDTLRPFYQQARSRIFNIGPLTEQRARALMAAIREQLKDEPDSFWPCRSRSHLIELLVLILQVSLDASNDSEGILGPMPGESHPVILYLLHNYHTKLSLDDLATEFGTNRSSLNQEFKKATGFSPIDYLIRLRVRIACQLLKDTGLPIAEIAEKVGYIDVTHFGRIFRKYTGQSPSAYRMQ